MGRKGIGAMIRILIVEDEKPIADLLDMSLTAAGYSCDCLDNGAAAADAVGEKRYDLILLDVMLPGIDGFELMEYLAPLEIPVIFITARSAVKDRIKGLKLGADDYIVKPFGTSELLARIRTAIRHTRTHLPNGDIAQSGQFSAKGLIIDYVKHQVLVDGRNVHLTQNEYKLVSLLGKYAGRVLTYDFIIRQLWGPKAKNDNQILRVNMANIRRKIEKNPAQPEYIFTEIGVGYRMVDSD